MMRRFLAAVRFLTIAPVAGDLPPVEGAPLFPLTGALLGAISAIIYTGALRLFPASIAALLALTFLIIMTGGLHEDALADVFDAFRARRSPERIHSILKDSRIGAFGALALIISILLRWQAIGSLGANAVPALAAAIGSSRGAMVVLARISKPAGEGLGRAFVEKLRAGPAAAAAIQGAALPFLCGFKAGVAALAGAAVATVAARAYFHRRIGGVTGDCLGALCQISEALLLLIFVCPLFT